MFALCGHLSCVAWLANLGFLTGCQFHCAYVISLFIYFKTREVFDHLASFRQEWNRQGCKLGNRSQLHRNHSFFKAIIYFLAQINIDFY